MEYKKKYKIYKQKYLETKYSHYGRGGDEDISFKPQLTHPNMESINDTDHIISNMLYYLKYNSDIRKENYDANIYFYCNPEALLKLVRKNNPKHTINLANNDTIIMTPYNNTSYKPIIPIFHKTIINPEIILLSKIENILDTQPELNKFITNMLHNTSPKKDIDMNWFINTHKYTDEPSLNNTYYMSNNEFANNPNLEQLIDIIKNCLSANKQILIDDIIMVKSYYMSRIQGILKKTNKEGITYSFIIKTYTNQYFVIDGWNNIQPFDPSNLYIKSKLAGIMSHIPNIHMYKNRSNLLFSIRPLTQDELADGWETYIKYPKKYLPLELNLLRISYVYNGNREFEHPLTIPPHLCVDTMDEVRDFEDSLRRYKADPNGSDAIRHTLTLPDIMKHLDNNTDKADPDLIASVKDYLKDANKIKIDSLDHNKNNIFFIHNDEPVPQNITDFIQTNLTYINDRYTYFTLEELNYIQASVQHEYNFTEIKDILKERFDRIGRLEPDLFKSLHGNLTYEDLKNKYNLFEPSTDITPYLDISKSMSKDLPNDTHLIITAKDIPEYYAKDPNINATNYPYLLEMNYFGKNTSNVADLLKYRITVIGILADLDYFDRNPKYFSSRNFYSEKTTQIMFTPEQNLAIPSELRTTEYPLNKYNGPIFQHTWQMNTIWLNTASISKLIFPLMVVLPDNIYIYNTYICKKIYGILLVRVNSPILRKHYKLLPLIIGMDKDNELRLFSLLSVSTFTDNSLISTYKGLYVELNNIFHVIKQYATINLYKYTGIIPDFNTKNKQIYLISYYSKSEISNMLKAHNMSEEILKSLEWVGNSFDYIKKKFINPFTQAKSDNILNGGNIPTNILNNFNIIMNKYMFQITKYINNNNKYKKFIKYDILKDISYIRQIYKSSFDALINNDVDKYLDYIYFIRNRTYYKNIDNSITDTTILKNKLITWDTKWRLYFIVKYIDLFSKIKSKSRVCGISSDYCIAEMLLYYNIKFDHYYYTREHKSNKDVQKRMHELYSFNDELLTNNLNNLNNLNNKYDIMICDFWKIGITKTHIDTLDLNLIYSIEKQNYELLELLYNNLLNYLELNGSIIVITYSCISFETNLIIQNIFNCFKKITLFNYPAVVLDFPIFYCTGFKGKQQKLKQVSTNFYELVNGIYKYNLNNALTEINSLKHFNNIYNINPKSEELKQLENRNLYISSIVAKAIGFETYKITSELNTELSHNLQNLFTFEKPIIHTIRPRNQQIIEPDINNNIKLFPELDILITEYNTTMRNIDFRPSHIYDEVKEYTILYENTLDQELYKNGYNTDNKPVSKIWTELYEILFHINPKYNKIYFDVMSNNINIKHNIKSCIKSYIEKHSNNTKLFFKNINKLNWIININNIDEFDNMNHHIHSILDGMRKLKKKCVYIFNLSIPIKYKCILDILYFMYNSFDNIEIIKPVQSKFDTSFYVVCINYNNKFNIGLLNNNSLLDITQQSLFSVDYEDDFKYQIIKIIDILTKQYCDIINMELFYVDFWSNINDKIKEQIVNIIFIKNHEFINKYLNTDNKKHLSRHSLLSLFGGTNTDNIKKKFHILFPFKQGINYNNLMITEEGKYSITPSFDSRRIQQLMESYIGKTHNLTITDITGNVGGDTINFGLHFKQVYSIEYDKDNYNALKNNIKVFGLNNIKLYHGDSTKIYNWPSDVLYADPPWGGPDYKSKPKLDLYLGEMRIDKFLKHIIRQIYKPHYIFLKLPRNYNWKRIKNLKNKEYISDYVIWEIRGYNLVGMRVLLD
jgi:hypothetical protein